MSSTYIEGIGYVAIDSNKSEAEKQATIEYMTKVAPKYKEMGGFWDGVGDTKSMIYRWGQKLASTDDEEKDRWYQEQIEEWGNMVGVYDSLALAKYYEDISKDGELTEGEQADNEANLAVLNQFKDDMHFAYDNREGDISTVQQKYGYDEEELTVMEGLGEFANMFADSPMYALGSIAGMIVKDPELLLMGYLRIPTMAGQVSARAVQLATQAARIQPKFAQKVGRFMQNSRVQAGVGRGVEGATYGGVYEALHDLTFKGYIDPENLKRGAALGALMGTAFGGISGQIGNKNWFVSKTGSEQAALKLAKPTNKPKTQPTIKDNVNKNYRPDGLVPEQAVLPKGLSHTARAELWGKRSIEILEDAWIRKNRGNRNIETTKEKSRIRTEHTQAVAKESKLLSQQKNKDGGKLFSRDEIKGLAQKNVARKIEFENKNNIDFAKEKIRDTSRPNWGKNREEIKAKKDLKDGTVIREKESFSDLFINSDAPPIAATTGQLVKGAVVGGIAGAYLAEEDKIFGSLLGMAAGALIRGKIKGIDVNQAKLKMKFYSVADKAKIITRQSELYTGKTMVTLKNILMGKNPKMTHLEFLDHIELYGTKKYAELRKNLSSEELLGINAVRELMRKFKVDAKKYGILKNEQFITDYIAHIFGNRKPPTGMKLVGLKKRLNQSLNDKSGNANFRSLNKTISQIAKEYPEYTIETDVFKILDGYSRSMSKAIAGAHMVKEISAVAILDGKHTIGLTLKQGQNKVMDALAEKMGYKIVDQPALKGMLVHPLVKNSIEDFFYTSVGSPLLLDKAIAVTNALKRIAISFSFFHAQSLVLSAAYAGAYFFTKAGKVRMKKVRELMDGQYETNAIKHSADGEIIGTTRNMTPNQFGDFTHAKLLKELAEYGVEIGVKANEFVDAGYSTMKRFYDKVPAVGKTQDWIDKVTWDVMHDHLKIFTYLTVKERSMSSTPRGLGKIIPKKYLEDGNWRALNEHEASTMAGKYVNDAFGGQSHTKLALEWQAKALENANNPKGAMYNWMALATSPSKAKLANLVLFSPDWTISNIRIAFRGMGMTKDIVTKLAKGGQLTAKEIAEFNMYAGYMTRGLVTTSFMAWLAHSFLSDDDSEFDLADFWDTGRLGLGGGEEMVISKQIAEPMHWLKHPMQTAWNKSSTLPKAIAEIFMGKEYITLKYDGYTGPSMDITNPKDLIKYAGSKITPISGSPWKRYVTDDDYTFGQATKASVAGMFGFPFYNRKD